MNALGIPPEVFHSIYAIALAAPRMLVAMSLLPYFVSQNLTRLMLSGVSIILTIPLVPVVMRQIPEHIDGSWLILIIVKECAIGLIIGFACAIPFLAATAMGFLIDNQRGATMAQSLDPGSGEMATPFGLMFGQAFNVMFLLAGGLSIFLTLMYSSYLAWPIVGWTPKFDSMFPTHILKMLDSLMSLAVMYASPAIVSMLLSEMALAFVSLFAPQLQVFFLAMPVKSGVATFILLIYVYTLTDLMTIQTKLIGDILPALRSVIQ